MDSISYSTLEKQATPTVWYGCYDGGWQNLISDLSFRHPAKFSRSLISRIYAYALERDWLKPGDCVLDPFGGVGLGSLDALSNGLSWVGVELEKSFTDLGQGCDCTGISKTDWVRFYGRWEKANYKDGRYWCPECLAEAKQITTGNNQLSFFEPSPSAAYTRNSGIIPETKPHHYTGNLELFKRYARPGTFAVLLNGDSRVLRSVIGQGIAEGLLSSPPYINSVNQSAGANDTEARIERMRQAGIDVTNRANVGGGNGVARQPQNYGESAGQLGAMPAGSLADSLLSSPPFAGNSGGRGEASRNGIDAALFDRHSGGMKKGTGDDPGNLDHLPMKGFDAALGSPPFENQVPSQASAEFHQKRDSIGKNNSLGRGSYGSTPGQLGSMSGGFDASLASPPFENSLAGNEPSNNRSIINQMFRGENNTSGGRIGKNAFSVYSSDPNNLGTEQGGTFWEAAKMIVSEAYLALKPGAYTFWVTKRFVRDGAIVDFTGQWRQLCEACGFEFVEHIQAMLIQSESEQGNLNGDVIKTKKKKASFFRRLHEKKFPHLAIDHEDVLVLRKPEALP